MTIAKNISTAPIATLAVGRLLLTIQSPTRENTDSRLIIKDAIVGLIPVR